MITLPEVIGLPPSSSVTDPLILNSMPQMFILPCNPTRKLGLNLFKLKPVWDEYEKMLEKFGYTTPLGGALRVAFLADNFPTDSFTNTYSESFLNRFSDIISSGVFEVQQVLGGGRDITKLPGAALEALGEMGGPFAAFAKGAKGAGTVVGAGIKEAYSKFVSSSGAIGKGIDANLQTLKGLLKTGRVDFPMIWKNSGFTPSYTITVRLYNPNPSSITMRKKYIIGPLAALLLLALPQTKDGSTYKWPFFHQIEAPGLFNIPSAYIGNITVVKGGDQQQIAFNQTLGMVDVRIEFGSLYDSMVAGKEYESTDRPTLGQYLKSLGTEKMVLKPTDESPQAENPDLIRLARITSDSSRQVQEYADMLAEANPRVPESQILAQAQLMTSQPSI